MSLNRAMTGEMIRIKSRDGFEFDAFHVRPRGPRRGGVIVIQEIFGISSHIRDMAERFAAEGYEAIAPSMFDRAAPGFAAEPHEVAEYMPKGRDLAIGNGPKNALNDMGAVFDRLKPAGPVAITGYCYGGTMSWLAAAQIEGLAAASCYYGGNIPQMADMQNKCPVVCHFGTRDAHIPKSGVDAFAAKHPDVPVYWYDADHGFARKGAASYDEASDKLAFERTLELFGKATK
jgi:carboxymethylenebutenolidase